MFEHWPFLTCINNSLYSNLYCLVRFWLEKIAWSSCTLNTYYLTSLRFINDISLMNLSNRLSGLLYIFRILFFSFVWSYSPNLSFKYSTFQSFLFRSQTPSVNSRSVWDCKGRNLFSIRKLFVKLFFLFLTADQSTKRDTNLYSQQFKSTFSLSLSPFPFFRTGLQK